jgi:hypothetical protein
MQQTVMRQEYAEIGDSGFGLLHAFDTDHGLYFVPRTQAWEHSKFLSIATHESQNEKTRTCRDIRNAAMIASSRKMFTTIFTVAQASIAGKKKVSGVRGESG